MRGFVYVTIGIALVYVALTGKANELIVAILTGTAPTTPSKSNGYPSTTTPIVPDPNRGTGTGSSS